ncbi:MAG: phosphotransferase [Rickettsiales bacterium]|jgi:Ser/Thr protein kinase RdoA (MazF antagonist)|nr:phosphotransferase [Rickettsiales bacterium]
MYEKRLDFDKDLGQVLVRACTAYGVGELQSFDLITNGYEDFNVKIQTVAGKYVAKIFSSSRTQSEVTRLISILEKVADESDAHPRLYRADGRIDFRDGDSNLIMVLMDYVNGRTFYEIGAPTDAELRVVVARLAEIHKIKFDDLPFQMDGWAVQNRHSLFVQSEPIIKEFPEYEFVSNAVRAFDNIPYDDLPRAFCHGDVSKQNTIRRESDGHIFFLDFSCANIYPRIHDLSVIATELMYKNGRMLPENSEILLDMYSEFAPLEHMERKYFNDYVRGAIATLYMNPVIRKYAYGDDSDQADFFISNARDLMLQLQG